MRRVLASLCLLAAASATAAGPTQPLTPAFFDALRNADLRVTTIGHRLAVANAGLCRDQGVDLGLAVLALDQFDGDARVAADRAFGFQAGVVVEGVVPDGPAARAGLVAGDSLLSIGGTALPDRPKDKAETTATRDAALAAIAGQSADGPVRVTVRRGGRDMAVAVEPDRACRVSVEMVLDDGWTADSDGFHIRIGSRFLEQEPDEAIAAVLAHELSHVVLRHRVRLEAAGVSHGLLKEVGRNGRLYRRTEDEADLLSVALLYNAGFPPEAAARFWRAGGPPGGPGLLRATYYRSNAERARRLAAAAAAIPSGARRPFVPALTATRDQPLG